MKAKEKRVHGGYYPFNVVGKEDHWYIYFPDLPGCHTTAKTWDEIGPRAQEVFELWTTVQSGAGRPVPDPSGYGSHPDWPTPVRRPVLTVGDMAENLGVSKRRVLAIAKARHLGRKVGNAIVFDPDDIGRMKPGPAGRPSKKSEVTV